MEEELKQPEEVKEEKVEKEFKRPDYLDPRDKRGFTASERKQQVFGLSPKQVAFLDEYLVDFNAARAARVLNLSRHKVQYWLKSPQFIAAIDANLERRRRNNEDLVRKTLEELLAVMTSDIKDYVNWTANHKIKLVPSKFIRNSKAIKGISKTRGGVRLILHDKVRGIELMMQGLGMMKKAKEEKLPQPGEKDDALEVSLLEALTKAHDERKALPQITGDHVIIIPKKQTPEEMATDDKDEEEAEGEPGAGTAD